jgi:hypothetical protein
MMVSVILAPRTLLTGLLREAGNLQGDRRALSRASRHGPRHHGSPVVEYGRSTSAGITAKPSVGKGQTAAARMPVWVTWSGRARLLRR